MKNYVGLDVSLKETAICVVDENGAIVAEGKTLSDPEAISSWLTALDLSVEKVGLEIGGLARWLYTELRALGWALASLQLPPFFQKSLPGEQDPRSAVAGLARGKFA